MLKGLLASNGLEATAFTSVSGSKVSRVQDLTESKFARNRNIDIR